MGLDQAVDELAVTTAIVSYKTPELATACARSVRAAGLDGPLEIIETGEPGPDAYLPACGAVLRRLDENVGYAAALNVVFHRAQTPILLALNADVLLPPEPVQPLLELFNEKPGLGILGVRQRDSKGRLTHCGIAEPGSPNGGEHFGEADQGQCRERFAVIAQVSGSVMFIRNAALQRIGGLERLPKLYYEDALLCLRMRRTGWTVGYSGLATFTHDIASSPSGERFALAAEARAQYEAEVAAGEGR